MTERSTPTLERNEFGYYYARWYVHDVAKGRWPRRTHSFKTKDRDEAETAFGSWMSKRGFAVAAAPRRMTVNDAARKYLAEKADPEGNGKTQRLVLLAPLRAFGDRDAASICADDAMEFRERRAKGFWGNPERTRKPIAASTIRRELNALQAALNWSLGASLRLPKPSEQENRKTWINEEQAKAMMEALAGEDVRVRAFTKMGLFYGARRGAILGLEWEWGVDFEGDMIEFQNPHQRVTRKRKPKVRIHPLLRQDLTELHDTTGGSGRVLRGRVAEMFTTFARGLGFPQNITPHVLKHSMATLSFRAGKKAWDIAEICGTDPRTLERTYGHHDPDRAAANMTPWL